MQYRVKEVLFGQDNTATGSTESVTGTVTITGTTVDTAKFTVDMTKVTSDSGQRDGQFRGRIMETSQFPTATFELTQPIELSSVPANLMEIPVKATGKLTLHGVTKDVTVDLTARLNGSNLEVNGTIPVTFADYNISNPSGGPAQVGDNGQIEVLLILRSPERRARRRSVRRGRRGEGVARAGDGERRPVVVTTLPQFWKSGS